MSLPLKMGQNINFNREEREPFYEMRTPDYYKDFYALSYIIKGKRKLFTANRFDIITAGSIIFINKDIHFRNTYLNESEYERICIKFTDKMIDEITNFIGIKKFQQIFETPVYHFNEISQNKLLALFNMMQTESNNYTFYSELILKGLLNQVIITTITEGKISLPSHIDLPKEEYHIINAVQYVDSHFAESPTMENVASQVFLSPTYFSKLFKKAMGCTYSTYLTYVKLDNAQRMLANTNLPISKISEFCGFSNSNYFSTVFEKVNGESPSSFRKKYI